MLQTKKFASALALTAGIAYVLCAIVVAVAPNTAVSLYASLAHLQKVEPVVITFSGFVIGLIEVLIYSFVAGLVFSSIYNKTTK